MNNLDFVKMESRNRTGDKPNGVGKNGCLSRVRHVLRISSAAKIDDKDAFIYCYTLNSEKKLIEMRNF